MRLTLLWRLCSYLMAVIAVPVLLSSCDVTKKTVYFRTLEKDTTLQNLVARSYNDSIIPGDFLSITVSSLSPENTTLYNVAPDALGEQKGYRVNESGDIEFFKLGKLHVAGTTTTALKERLQKELEPYLAQNIVSVSVINRHITMMGAVSPKVIPLTPNMTLLDALAESGDIGEKGRNDNILVIREKDQGSARDFKRLKLSDHSIFYSPYFYLQPNDIVYVEPRKPTTQVMQIASFAMSTISFILLLINRFR
ncbi:MAG: polysaccharide biosynthesis/export family protein [Chitinophagaceae bacterium]|nr:polysaccharide biosynthesis/export family protein [Chitinophagaceae bacterium]